MDDGDATLRERLTTMAAKLERLRREGWKKRRHVFRVEAHRFRAGSPLSEADVRAFELRHGVRLPADHRAFLLHLGDGGAGPYYGLLPLDSWGDVDEGQEDPLRQPSLLLPGVDYPDDWDEITEEPYRGTLPIAERGCGGFCALIVTGEARGRVVYVGDGAPYFVSDASFVDWYERWLDELIEGVDASQFGYTRGGTEAELVEAYRGASGYRERIEIVASLGRRSPITERSHPVLLEASSAEDPEARATALYVLAKGGDTFTSVIVEKLRDPHPRVREAAVRALVRQDRVSSFARELNEALARETDASAFFSIGHALQGVNGIRLASLVPHVDNVDVGLRRYAAHFFSKTTAVEGMEGFERLLTDEDVHVRIYAREGFSKRRAGDAPGEAPSTSWPRSWWDKWRGRG